MSLLSGVRAAPTHHSAYAHEEGDSQEVSSQEKPLHGLMARVYLPAGDSAPPIFTPNGGEVAALAARVMAAK
jgi:hypothetical protein